MSKSAKVATNPFPTEGLRLLLGPENVIVEPNELAFYSTDVYRRADIDAEIIIRPGTVDELARAVRFCTDHGMAVIPRGGGLS
jgi:FAD/FMN-containing dehydrogenase